MQISLYAQSSKATALPGNPPPQVHPLQTTAPPLRFTGLLDDIREPSELSPAQRERLGSLNGKLRSLLEAGPVQYVYETKLRDSTHYYFRFADGSFYDLVQGEDNQPGETRIHLWKEEPALGKPMGLLKPNSPAAPYLRLFLQPFAELYRLSRERLHHSDELDRPFRYYFSGTEDRPLPPRYSKHFFLSLETQDSGKLTVSQHIEPMFRFSKKLEPLPQIDPLLVESRRILKGIRDAVLAARAASLSPPNAE